MSRYNKVVDFTWREVLVQGAILVAFVILIVWLLPSGGRSVLHYDVGRPWPYSQFIAPFDFPIFKTDEQLSQEQDSIHKLYEPYFEFKTGVEAQQLNHFRETFRNKDAEELTPIYRIYIESHFREIYDRGIITNDDQVMLQKDSTQAVKIYEGIGALSQPVSMLFSQKTAYEYIIHDADSAGLSRAKLQRLNLNHYLEPNLVYDKEKSESEWGALMNSLSPSSGMVLAGQNVIDRGEIINERTFQILKSYERTLAARADNSRPNNMVLLGQILYVAIITLAMLLFFNLFRRDYIVNPRCIILILCLAAVYPLLTSFLVRHTLLTVYIIPYAMLPIFVRVFMDSRTAFMVHAGTIMLCAISLRYPFEFITTQCVAGLVAIYTLRELSQRSQIFKTAIAVTAASLFFYLSIDLIHGRSFLSVDTIGRIDWSFYKHMIISGILLLFSYPLMYLLERAFGFTSNVTLVELSNINNALLQRLSEVAPGTFQHSMQVSNLASEVARKIGAKVQLVRTGALYHDIGKTVNPAFFTENQAAGSVNPHDKLSPEESARIIISHVTDGERLADNQRIPRIIRDFISTHHGHGLVRYFYITAQNQNPSEPVPTEPFTYPGQNPTTTEQAILMMADAVEASARSLKEYTEESIASLVDRIIDGQIEAGYFTACPITFADILKAKEVFREKLKTIYHTRISYPAMKKQEEPETNTKQTMKKNLLPIVLALSFTLGAAAQKTSGGGISAQQLQRFQQANNIGDARTSTLQKALGNALATNAIDALAQNRATAGEPDTDFSVETPKQSITDQRSSGRCWMFSGLNVLRGDFSRRHNDTLTVEFSQDYLFFYDQLEKANLMLQGVIDCANEPLEAERPRFFFHSPLNDGGTFCGLVDLAPKYGLVPKAVCPETFSAENTAKMRQLISRKLREFGLELRRMVAEKRKAADIQERKTQQLSEIYRLLTLTLGEPVKEFTYAFRDKNNKVRTREKRYTPQTFYEEIMGGQALKGSFIMVMNDPRREFHKTYEVEWDRHAYDGTNWVYLNLPMEEIEQLAIAQLRDGRKLYSSYDVGKQLDRKRGYADTENFDYASLLGTTFPMTKAERISTFDSGSTHAMTLTAVDLDADGKPLKWKVENSWGTDSGQKGYIIMTSQWFREYMFRLVVDKKYVSEQLLREAAQKPVLVMPEDPLFQMDE
ncbi:MAG: HDIG domain-containing protein [Bacteroidaceae bacterium]|nr:HDIG domain-containing protein [Bacteroidaceae bacterium]